MTEEFKMKLKSHHDDEIKDVEAYKELSKEAESLGRHDICGVLKDISHDEQTHASVLKHILEEG